MTSTVISSSARLMFIGGEWASAASGAVIETVNPATEEVIGVVPAGAAADIERAVQAAGAAAPAWAGLAWTVRSRRLAELASRLRSRVDELALIDVDDAGLPLRAMRNDVLGAAADLDYFAGLGGEVKGFTVPTQAESLAYTRREPYGVVGRITPFNHPLRFTAGKVAAPLAAGNAVVVKPPEQASLSALEFAGMAGDLLPPGVLNVVTGTGHEAGAALAAHPAVPRIAFSGGVPAGRAVLRAAAEHIKHVTLELGGKNPIIVCPDADVSRAASATVAGMNLTTTMGQSCMSTSRVFVHEDIRDDFAAVLRGKVEALRVGNPRDEDVDMGPLAFRTHYERVLRYIETGRAEGATLLAGGRRPPALATGFYIQPTIFTDVEPGMRIAIDEIFGPVIAVLTWSTEDELFEMVNGVDFGLTASIWTRDIGRAQRFTSMVQSGLVWINGSAGKPAGLPFGGYKLSGLGKESCLEELLSYTREKSIVSMIPSW